jgi:hypothetical protein
MRSKVGRVLVEHYYRYSPAVAEFISRHAAFRTSARIHLLPVVGLSFVALLLGPGNCAIFLVSALVVPAFLTLFRNRKKRLSSA